MKRLISLCCIIAAFAAAAQSDQEIATAIVDLEDVSKFLSKHAGETLFLAEADGYVSLQDGESQSELAEDQSVMVFESKIDKKDKSKVVFTIDDYVFGKATISTKGQLSVRRVSMVAGTGKNKSKMVTLEF